MSKIYDNLTQLIGNTPLLKLNKFCEYNKLKSEIYGKIEGLNPGGSIKDRVGLSMIEDAEKRGVLKKGSVIIEPTSGNTGIGLAWVALSKGYEVILTMPESMSIERRNLLKAFGAKLVLTPASEGMSGAIKKAEELSKEIKDSFIPGQFVNPANPLIHYQSTGVEIYDDMDGEIDYFVAGVGTGGTLSGSGKYLKEKNNKIKVVAVEPFDSAVLSGEKAGPHKLQGIGAGFIPDTLDISIIDEIIKIKNEDAYEMVRLIAKTEGLLVGVSAGAAVAAACEIAKKYENKKIAVILPDKGERYLSVEGLF